jgi:hypothetical protein
MACSRERTIMVPFQTVFNEFKIAIQDCDDKYQKLLDNVIAKFMPRVNNGIKELCSFENIRTLETMDGDIVDILLEIEREKYQLIKNHADELENIPNIFSKKYNMSQIQTDALMVMNLDEDDELTAEINKTFCITNVLN